MDKRHKARGRTPPGRPGHEGREWIRRTLAAAAGVVLFLALCYIGWLIFREWKAARDLEGVSRSYTTDPEAVSGPDTGSAGTGETYTDALLYREIDFAGLMSVNPDITAWIYIPDTAIDYPVCLGEDDSWYLTHDYRGEKSASGAIFLYAGSSMDDAALWFFGHNMRTGVMFGGLKKYKEDDYLAGHPYVYVYTPGESCRAAVFAALEVSASGPAYEAGRELGTEEYAEWIADSFPLRDASPVKEVTGEERILILSTCTGNRTARRYVVCAVVDQIRTIEK